MKKAPLLELTIVVISIGAFLLYKLHDLTEPFAYGHTRWVDATFYWFGMMHVELGLDMTGMMNVEGFTENDELFYYRSFGPLTSLAHAGLLYVFNGEPWAVRIFPLLANLLNLVLLSRLGVMWLGQRSIVYLTVLYLGSPFLLKYGASDAGFLSFSMTLGLGGWVLYHRFLENGRRSILYCSLICFAVGVGFSWQAGFMALPIYLHMLFGNHPIAEKRRQIALFSLLMAISILTVLVHQGVVTGDYLYPLRRVLERSDANVATGTISWVGLVEIQGGRMWGYFGPVVCILSGYWLIRRVFKPALWSVEDIWIGGLFLTGSFLGLFIKQAAFYHDYLMLGFAPGLMLAAAAGGMDIKKDIGSLFTGKRLRNVGWVVASVLLIIHAALAIKSARYFEIQEQNDLNGGEAQVAYYLRDSLPANAVLVSDASSGYHTMVSTDNKVYGNLRPHLAYLTRRPVRFVESVAELERVLFETRQTGRVVAIVQLDYGNNAGGLNIPSEWIVTSQSFGKARVVLVALNE
ncbi:hypothetical protein N9H39_00955 [Gammaproteobacteria bacterium]|nr:hypothetical protein [Gammaproteobacteria bacterium]